MHILSYNGVNFEPIPAPVGHTPNAGSCMIEWHDRWWQHSCSARTSIPPDSRNWYDREQFSFLAFLGRKPGPLPNLTSEEETAGPTDNWYVQVKITGCISGSGHNIIISPMHNNSSVGTIFLQSTGSGVAGYMYFGQSNNLTIGGWRVDLCLM